MKKRKLWIFLVFVIILCVVVIFVVKRNRKQDSYFATAFGISEITEKIHTDDYYLQVRLDDYLVEDYHLPTALYTLRAEKSVYDKVTAGQKYVGASVVVKAEEGYSLSLCLKTQKTDGFRIVGVTDTENRLLE